MTPLESHVPFGQGSARGATGGADVSTFQTKLDAAVRKMEEQVVKVEEQEGRIRKFEEKLEARETRAAETLAVYVTLFTFLSVNINIFTRVSDLYTAIWFMLLMTVCALIIASSLFFFLHNRGKWQQLLLVVAFLVALTALLVVPSLNSRMELNPVTIGGS
jgi:hypothetical protein